MTERLLAGLDWLELPDRLEGGDGKAEVKERLHQLTSRIPIGAWPLEYQQALRAAGRVVNGCTPLSKGPEHFEIVVAGGPGGLHSMFLPTYGDTWPITRVAEAP